MATTKKLSYSRRKNQHPASWEAGVEAEGEEAPLADPDEVADVEYEPGADPDYDDTVQLDYDESGQLAYDEAADPDYGDEGVGAEVEAASVTPLAAAASPAADGFTYELGRTVLPSTQQQQHPVVWRGHLKERHPVTGLVHRVPVYRLDDGHWDCYREEELRAA